MSRHATAEVLSAYVDQELEPESARELRRHLEACDDCRARLASVRRVVSGLRRLERVSPPAILARDVERRISLAGEPSGLIERLESRLPGAPLSSPHFFTFALVCALAVLVYLFAHGVDKARRPRTTLIVETSAPAGVLAIEESRRVGERTFDRVAGRWFERDLPADLPVRAIGSASAEGQRILDDLAAPGDEPLELPIRLRWENEVVEVRATPKPARSAETTAAQGS